MASSRGTVNPVICTYDLTKFGGELVEDIMRTHPLVMIGGTPERIRSCVSRRILARPAGKARIRLSVSSVEDRKPER